MLPEGFPRTDGSGVAAVDAEVAAKWMRVHAATQLVPRDVKRPKHLPSTQLCDPRAVSTSTPYRTRLFAPAVYLLCIWRVPVVDVLCVCDFVAEV
jgi:hypothetical protein